MLNYSAFGNSSLHLSQARSLQFSLYFSLKLRTWSAATITLADLTEVRAHTTAEEWEGSVSSLRVPANVQKIKTKIASKLIIIHSENKSIIANKAFFLSLHISTFPCKVFQYCYISTCVSPSPKKTFYWQVASNIFPKARIKRMTVCKSLSSQYSHKNSNKNSHPIPRWKLREGASETGSDNGINRKREDRTVWSDWMT